MRFCCDFSYFSLVFEQHQFGYWWSQRQARKKRARATNHHGSRSSSWTMWTHHAETAILAIWPLILQTSSKAGNNKLASGLHHDDMEALQVSQEARARGHRIIYNPVSGVRREKKIRKSQRVNFKLLNNHSDKQEVHWRQECRKVERQG